MGRSPTNTKAKLLETANDLIWKSSYGSVSVDNICRASGVNKGSFYHYFPSKVELAVAAMDAAYEHFNSELQDVFSNDIKPIKRFENLAIFIYEKQKQAYDKHGRVCGCPFASLGSEMAGNEAIIQAKADEILDHQRHIFEPSIHEMVNAGLLPKNTNITNKASQILIFIMGQVMMARIQNDLTFLKEDIRLGLLQTLGIDDSALCELSSKSSGESV